MTALHSRRVAHRPGARATRLALTLGAVTLAGAGGGCAIPPRIEVVSHDGDHAGGGEPFDWPRAVRVGVVGGDFGRHVVLRDRVVDALREGVDRVFDGYRPGRTGERVDYVVDIDVSVEGQGHPSNFLAVFPGFAIFMPSWYQLRYDYEVTTRVRLWRGDGGGRVDRRPGPRRRLTLTDRYRARDTSPGIALGAYIGWGALLFPPLLISPLVTGVVAATDEWDPHLFAHLLAHDPDAGWRYANGVARAIRDLIDEELRVE